MKGLIQNKWEEAMSYETYIDLLNQLVAAGKTTGENQSEAMVGHTKMGLKRINKWQKITKLSEDTVDGFKHLKGNYGWLLIAEAWCGDVGQNIATLKAMADEKGIELKVVLRDENLDLMDLFLTNGGRSIPKLVVFDRDTYEVKADWGPRPDEIQDWFLAEKSKADFEYAKTSEQMHLWYAKNKQQALQTEIVKLMQKIDA